MKKIFLLAITLLLLGSWTVVSANTLDVFINEIAWMGTATSANDEWIELYNNTNENINVDGWILKTTDEKLKINLQGQIVAHGFYVLERTDDTSVPNITADVIYRGALNNSGQDIVLYDKNGNVVDRANFTSGWPKGDNTTKRTMERVDFETWQTSKDTGGTPMAKNSLGVVVVAAKSAVTTNLDTLPKTEKSDTSMSVATASLNDSIDSYKNLPPQESSSPWLLFLISIAVIIFLAIITFVIKFNIFSNFSKWF